MGMGEIIDMTDCMNVYVVGDIHGEFKSINYIINKRYKIENSLFIFAGDCGIGFSKPQWISDIHKYLIKYLSQNNNYFLLVRGNHDDPSYFNEDKRLQLDRFISVPDYSVIKSRIGDILCIGGAISIDYQWRMDYNKFMDSNGSSKRRYWEDEGIIYNYDLLPKSFDYIVSHAAPKQCRPFTRRFSECSEEKMKDIYYERNYLQGIVDNHNVFKSWYYGHYHQSNNEILNNMKFVGLNINEISMLS